MKKAVSVIVPIYNVEKYVEVSLKSICNQKFLNYEIIIVNDGTLDKSMDIVESVLKESTVSYTIINQKNSGLPAARNAGLLKASGEFVCFIDSDDVLDENFIASQFKVLKENKLMACFCDFEFTNEENRIGTHKINNNQSILEREELLVGFMKRRLKIHCCSLLLNRKYLIDNNILFNESLRFGEDVEFMWRLFPSIEKIGYIKAPYYKYLLRENSLMSNQNIERIINLNEIYSNTILNIKKQYPNDEKVLKFMPARTTIALIHSFAKQSNYNTFRELIIRLKYKDILKQLYNFPDIKIRILARILNYSPKVFYKLFNI